VLSLPERILVPGEEVSLPNTNLTIHVKCCSKFDGIQSSFNTFCFSCANIYGNISVASRKEGDSLLPEGRNGTRSVKKWMIEAKIPRSRRGLVPVLRDEKGVLAVYGLGQRAGTLPKPGEPCITVEIKEKEAREKYD
jgi:tRNA(Ile)-lysidine synthase